uniref:Rubis-subs-bind domain-containing protein n=1 Tax=Syphacia muris TaxID=451379 RepID=A0A0N5ALA1_9BILA
MDKIEPSVIEQHVDSESDDENIDFFGLNSVETTETTESVPETKIFTTSYGPERPKQELDIVCNLTLNYANVALFKYDFFSHFEAARLIYSNDIALYGGTERDASATVDNIVDVSVDQVLGPNIRANLLKNLHNKSLAEADAKDIVARRKHQITYLATVAVAREEQLAEQWSQNRHAKRMSAQKYGF